MRISKIETESTEVVKGQIADVIYFQQDGGKLMRVFEVVDELSPMSSVVVLGGEEPSNQYRELVELIDKIEDKKIVLKTTSFNRDLHNMCDKVVFIFKTFDLVHEYLIEHINNHLNKYVPLVFIGHGQFNLENFETLCKNLDVLYVQAYDDENADLSEESQIADKHNSKLIQLKKIPL